MKSIFGLLKHARDKVTGLSAIQSRFDVLQKKIDGLHDALIGKNESRASNESDSAVFLRAESIIWRAINLGKKGRLKISPETICIASTTNCNLKCIMYCIGHTGTSGPKISIEEFDGLVRPLAGSDVNFGWPKLLDMTCGEPTLNRDIATMYRLFKDLFPEAKISMISNATLPIRGRIREVFELTDRIGLSMDGATEETYERIRQGSVYKNVIRNIKDIVSLKQGASETLQILFVAMDQNIHELTGMIRLAHSLGVSTVFAQAVEVRLATMPFNFEGQNIQLTLPKSELASCLISAKSEAKRLGVDLLLTSTLQDALRQDEPIETIQNPHDLNSYIKTCSYPWIVSPAMVKNNEKGVVTHSVCCHMPLGIDGMDGWAEKTNGKSILEIFNSDFYWGVRQGLLDGSLAAGSCLGCQYFRATQWSAGQLRALEAAVNSVECSV